MPIRILPVTEKRKAKRGQFRNTQRENRLEELGRVDAEKAYTSKGKRNLRDEKHRIRKELKSGGKATTPEQEKKWKDKLKEFQTKPRIMPTFGGSEKAKPHSTKEGRHAAGRRRFKRIIEKLTPKARPRPLPSPGRPARPVRPLPSPGGSSHTRPIRPLLPKDMKREKKAVGSVVKGAGKIGKKFLDFIKTGKLVDKHGVKVNVPKAAERLTGKPHVDHGKRKKIKHLGKGKATGGRIGLQHGSRPRPQGPHVPHPHRPRGVKIAKRW